ncbi:MAG: C10 family peptidase, partial [Kiritimatiellae bacterium]|nr:C10 family peptidase [Kiritimatiellia bacterium]
ANQGATVSRLMRDLGTLANTAYRPGGTAGTFGKENLVSYFGYKGAGYKYTMPLYWENDTQKLQDDWGNLMERQVRGSLHAGAPMVVSIFTGSGGHAIICDGYGYAEDGTLLFHFHYGWGSGSGQWKPLSWFSHFTSTVYNDEELQTSNINVHPTALGCVLAGRVARGGVGVAGMTVTLSTGKSVTTDAAGGYVFTGLAEQTTYTVTVAEGSTVVETRSVTTGRIVDDNARQTAQDEWEDEHGKEVFHWVPLEGGNVIADFDLPAPTVYVTASGTGKGTSWADAAPLSPATLSTLVSGTTVCVASGNYTITETLTVPAGITVKGSYDPASNTQSVYASPTTLTLGTGAYGYPPGYLFDINATGVIDGFVLENSQDWSNCTVNGGTAKNCIFTGTYTIIAQSSRLICCIARNKSSTQEGSSLIHCSFYGDIPIGKDSATGTMAGNLGNVTADYPTTSGGCTCGVCPSTGLDGRALNQTHGALAPAAGGYSLMLR